MSSARVTDANGNSGLALHRPGFRFIVDDAAGAHAKEVAYRRADAEMVKAWRNLPSDAANSRVCPACDGSGLDEFERELIKIRTSEGRELPSTRASLLQELRASSEFTNRMLGRRWQPMNRRGELTHLSFHAKERQQN